MDDGRAYAHFEEFVRTEVLGQLSQRAFRCCASAAVRHIAHVDTTNFGLPWQAREAKMGDGERGA